MLESVGTTKSSFLFVGTSDKFVSGGFVSLERGKTEPLFRRGGVDRNAVAVFIADPEHALPEWILQARRTAPPVEGRGVVFVYSADEGAASR